MKLYIFISLPGVACLLQSSEPSLGSSSLPLVHTPGYSPSMSPVTAQMAEKKRRWGGGGTLRIVLAAQTNLMIYKTCAIMLIIPLNKQSPAIKHSFSP